MCMHAWCFAFGVPLHVLTFISPLLLYLCKKQLHHSLCSLSCSSSSSSFTLMSFLLFLSLSHHLCPLNHPFFLLHYHLPSLYAASVQSLSHYSIFLLISTFFYLTCLSSFHLICHHFINPPSLSSLSWIGLIDVTTILQKQVKQKLRSVIIQDYTLKITLM